MTRLSIIIPCYNCAATLEDAVASVYRQESPIPFDVTMVDDGSTDRTFEVMTRLAARYPDIRLVKHAGNRGGGAARNTAVESSDGDLIFCLDSDDMLGPDFMRNLVRFWLAKKCDGVGISTSIKFRNTDIRNVAYVTTFEGPGAAVRFESLFDSSACSLLSTFLITRTAFNSIGGYPTSHGFDTQGMAFRFLCSGLTAYTCPDTIYYHRVQHGRSYFLREAEAGRTHWNWFKIFEEFLYLFDDDVKARILEHEYFPTGARLTIESDLAALQKERYIYAEDFQRLLGMGRDAAAEKLAASSSKYDQYWVGTYHLARGNHGQALDYFVHALRAGFSHRIIFGYLMEIAAFFSGNKIGATLSMQDVIFRIGPNGMQAESSAVPISLYQRFENKLLEYGALSMVGRGLRALRMLLRRLGVDHGTNRHGR